MSLSIANSSKKLITLIIIANVCIVLQCLPQIKLENIYKNNNYSK